MPEPERATEPLTVGAGPQAPRLQPVPMDIEPSVSASRAWQRATAHSLDTGGGVDRLLLGYYGTEIPSSLSADSPGGPRLVWVLFSTHVAVRPRTPLPAPFPTTSTEPAEVCMFINSINVVDATTGEMLLGSGYQPA